MNADSKIVLIAKRNGLQLEWQELRSGYRRAVISCKNWTELGAVKNLFRKNRNFWIDSWASGDGLFEGYVYVMGREDHEALTREMTEEADRIEEWWQRYHAADMETRKLMACGAIS